MKFILLISLCIFYMTIFIEAVPTVKVNSVTRIIGRQTAFIENYPYQVALRMDYGLGITTHFCGGSIVSNRHIVTAAHCIDNKRDTESLRAIRVFTGTSRSDFGGEAHSVKSITIHPEYVGWSNFFYDDIAILTLNEPITFSATQQPIGLPTNNVISGVVATITGWGDNSFPNGETPIHLQKATMNLLESDKCQPQLIYPLRNTQVCATTRLGYGICSGDSGGPLVANSQLVGVASYVSECGSGKPEVYTNVYPYIDFIMKTINAGGSLYTTGV